MVPFRQFLRCAEELILRIFVTSRLTIKTQCFIFCQKKILRLMFKHIKPSKPSRSYLWNICCDSNSRGVSVYHYIRVRSIHVMTDSSHLLLRKVDLCVTEKASPLSPPASLPSHLIFMSPFCPSTDNTSRQPAASVLAHHSPYPSGPHKLLFFFNALLISWPAHLRCQRRGIKLCIILERNRATALNPEARRAALSPENQSADRGSSEE